MRKFYLSSLSVLLFCASLFCVSPIHAQTTVTVGTGTTSASTNAFVATSTTTNRYSFNYTIYNAAEIIANGGFAGLISKLAWQKAGTGEYTTPDATFKVWMKHVSFGTHTTGDEDWATLTAGATPVFSSNTFSWPTGTGFKEVTLQTPFVWDGVQNNKTERELK